MAEVPTKHDRIDGWKSIADYLNRDVTTVIRWAKLHGLPVNRVPPGSPRRAVFALKSELDAWVAKDSVSSNRSVTKSVQARPPLRSHPHQFPVFLQSRPPRRLWTLRSQ